MSSIITTSDEKNHGDAQEFSSPRRRLLEAKMQDAKIDREVRKQANKLILISLWLSKS